MTDLADRRATGTHSGRGTRAAGAIGSQAMGWNAGGLGQSWNTGGAGLGTDCCLGN